MRYANIANLVSMKKNPQITKCALLMERDFGQIKKVKEQLIDIFLRVNKSKFRNSIKGLERCWSNIHC